MTRLLRLALALRSVIGIGSVAALGFFMLILTVGKGFDAFRSGAASEYLLRTLLTIRTSA